MSLSRYTYRSLLISLLGVAALFLLIRATFPFASTEDRSISYQPASYSPLWIPEAITGTTIHLTLRKSSKQLLPGEATTTYGYNGADFWGPTLILNQGDPMQINVTNQLDEATTTHWHGLHVPAVMDGGPHQEIRAGETWSPSFEVKNQAATYWYHPHLHEKTQEQLTYGAGGLIIVKDAQEAALPLPRSYGVDDIPLILTSRRFLANHQFNTTDAYGDSLLTNGTLNAQANLPAQFVRLRILNAEIERAYNLGFADQRTFYVIANDGGLLDAPVAVQRLKLYVGERVEVLVDLTKEKVGSTLDLQSFNQGQTFGFPGGEDADDGEFGSLLNNHTFPVLHIQVITPTANAITSLPSKLIENQVWKEADVTHSRTLTITEHGPGTPFEFDHTSYQMETVNQTVKLNALEKWTVVNSQIFDHAFHLHDVQFQIIARSNGPIAEYERGWKDTVSIPIGESVTFLAKFEDFADASHPYMYHCHFANHEDEGMMGQFVVVE